MIVFPVDKGQLQAIEEGNNKVYNLVHNNMHIELKLVRNERAVLRQKSAMEIIAQGTHARVGSVAKIEIDGAIVEIRVIKGGNARLQQNIISTIKDFNGVSWDLDVYGSGQSKEEGFIGILQGGLRNSFDYKKLYIEFNLSEGQEHIASKHIQPSMDTIDKIDIQSFIDSLNDMDGIGDINFHIYNENGEKKVYTSVGRNETCTCGSGKKYKKCCGR